VWKEDLVVARLFIIDLFDGAKRTHLASIAETASDAAHIYGAFFSVLVSVQNPKGVRRSGLYTIIRRFIAHFGQAEV